MFCAGRPSFFGALPLLEMNSSSGRNGNSLWGSHPMMGLMQEVLGNGVRFEDLVGSSQPNCVDNSGRRHCRTHCYGHSNPEDILEQFIIENTMKDTHKTSEERNVHQCKKATSETNESNTSEFRDKEKQTDKREEFVPESLLNDEVSEQYTPWTISVDMAGCDEVRARIEENKIVVEGQTRNTEGFMTVKRVLTLPSHVKGKALTSTLGRNGTLTLTEKQMGKENLVTDIPLSKENSCIGQSENQSVQDEQIDTPEVNMNDSNLPEKQHNDKN